MNMTIEGIETQQMVDVLSSVNASAYQGYLFSKPVAEEQAILISDSCNFKLKKKQKPTQNR